MIHISSADRTVEDDSDSSFTIALRPPLSGVKTLALMQATIPNTGLPFAASDSECIFYYEQSHPDDLMIAQMPTNIQFWDLNMVATYCGQAMSAGVGAYDSSITAVNRYTCQFLPEANTVPRTGWYFTPPTRVSTATSVESSCPPTSCSSCPSSCPTSPTSLHTSWAARASFGPSPAHCFNSRGPLGRFTAIGVYKPIPPPPGMPV